LAALGFEGAAAFRETCEKLYPASRAGLPDVERDCDLHVTDVRNIELEFLLLIKSSIL
jgi:hypothetical protein